jgi:DNA polymerase-4
VGSGVVASASYEARRFGIAAGTPLRKARELCPGLTVITGHAPIYRCFSESVFAICGDYSPALETFLDEAYCDWNGTDLLYPDPVAVAARIRQRILDETGLTVTIGLARNRMLAKMTSKSAKPNGLRELLPGDEETFLRDLPVGRLPGVGPQTEKLFTQLNIRTIHQLRCLSRESLRAMLGLPGAILYDRCRGEDTQAVSRREIPRSIRRETSFHQPAIDRQSIHGMLHYLTERSAHTLRSLHLEARQLGVKIRHVDGQEAASTRKLPAPTQLDTELFALAVALLDTLYVRRAALHLIGVVLTGLQPATGLRQLTFFDRRAPVAADERRELRLLESLDAIRGRYGYASVVCGKSLHLLGKLDQDDHGFILRTASLTK